MKRLFSFYDFEEQEDMQNAIQFSFKIKVNTRRG